MRLVLSLILLLLPSIAFANLGDGLVGWWAMEEGTGTSTLDSKWGGNAGTLTNGPTWLTNCAKNKCVHFDGSDDFILIAGSVVYASTTLPFSLSCWVYLDGFDGTEYPEFLGLKSDLSSPYDIFISNDTAGSSYQGINIGGNATWSRLKNDVAWVTGKWQHIVVTYNGAAAGTAGNFHIYLNTVDQTLVASGTFGTSTNQTVIGGTGDGITEDMRGAVDNVFVYNRVLTTQEIKDLYNAGIQYAN